jgi:hypothetical protein
MKYISLTSTADADFARGRGPRTIRQVHRDRRVTNVHRSPTGAQDLTRRAMERSEREAVIQ